MDPVLSHQHRTHMLLASDRALLSQRIHATRTAHALAVQAVHLYCLRHCPPTTGVPVRRKRPSTPPVPPVLPPPQPQVFLQNANVNLLSSVLDTPSFFWSAPDHLQALYERACEYLGKREGRACTLAQGHGPSLCNGQPLPRHAIAEPRTQPSPAQS